MAELSKDEMDKLVDDATRAQRAGIANSPELITYAFTQIGSDMEDASYIEVMQVQATLVAAVAYTLGLVTQFDEIRAKAMLQLEIADIHDYIDQVYPNIKKTMGGGESPESVA